MKPRTVCLPATALSRIPRVGDYLITSPSRRPARITAITTHRTAGSNKPPRLTITLTPVAPREIPASETPVRVQRLPRTLTPTPPHEPPQARPRDAALASRLAARRLKASAEAHQRAKALLADDRDPNRHVPTIQIQPVKDNTGRTVRPPVAETAEWVDPDDLAPNRRFPKRIHGHRAADPMNRVQMASRAHRDAVKRLRDAYAIGIQGARPGYAPPVLRNAHFGPGAPPQERRLRALRSFLAARKALGPLFPILQHVALDALPLAAYARSHRLNKSVAMGYLLASLDALRDHYEPPRPHKPISRPPKPQPNATTTAP